jgi:hypothetical protein
MSSFVGQLSAVVAKFPRNTLPIQIGWTDYIDSYNGDTKVSINNEEQSLGKALDKYGCIWGNDARGRFYVLFRFSESESSDSYITCFFKRRDNDDNSVMCAGVFYLMRTFGGMDDSQCNILVRLLTDGSVTLTKKEAQDNRMKGYVLALMSAEEENQEITYRIDCSVFTASVGPAAGP